MSDLCSQRVYADIWPEKQLHGFKLQSLTSPLKAFTGCWSGFTSPCGCRMFYLILCALIELHRAPCPKSRQRGKAAESLWWNAGCPGANTYFFAALWVCCVLPDSRWEKPPFPHSSHSLNYLAAVPGSLDLGQVFTDNIFHQRFLSPPPPPRLCLNSFNWPVR